MVKFTRENSIKLPAKTVKLTGKNSNNYQHGR